jgi:hypothetical protein
MVRFGRCKDQETGGLSDAPLIRSLLPQRQWRSVDAQELFHRDRRADEIAPAYIKSTLPAFVIEVLSIRIVVQPLLNRVREWLAQ